MKLKHRKERKLNSKVVNTRERNQNYQNPNNKLQKGITLIALVITIIVLLILAGVSIATLTGDNGILTKASNASEETRGASVEEAVELWKTEHEINNYGSSIGAQDLKKLVDDLMEQKLLTEEEKDKILGNTDKEIEASYQIKIGKRTIKFANDNWDGENKINAPVLKKGMKPVYWDENGNEIKQGDNNFDESKWYEYKAGNNTVDSKDSKWANAITEDGSYWVWIPRYEYKLTDRAETEEAGKIEVKFIPTTVTEADTEGYLIHPAFKNGTNNHYMNGEWDKEISGIWVAKYKMSMEEKNVENQNWEPKNPTNATIGEVSTSSTIRAVSKPGVQSWRYISIGKMYYNSYNYDRSKESHLMKNSEWGAIVYLAHSEYGRNRTEITKNGDSSFYTAGQEKATASTNKDQSTTGNENGIYDLSGGSWENVAGYIANGNEKLKFGITDVSFPLVATLTENIDAYKSLSTKYSTVYPFVSNNTDNNTLNWRAYNDASSAEINYGYGDAILETATDGRYETSWFGDASWYAIYTSPFITRGGTYSGGSGAGSFSFGATDGDPEVAKGFRMVLICE